MVTPGTQNVKKKKISENKKDEKKAKMKIKLENSSLKVKSQIIHLK